MKICVIIPYIGVLPENFDVWLYSCAKNEHIDWVLITDNEINFPQFKNIIMKNMTLQEINRNIKGKIGEDYEITKPYKLCDYKPLYGLLFDDVIVGYDYWGYCDMDLIFGDLKKFIPIDTIAKAEMVQLWGHFTLIKNDKSLLTTIKCELEDNFNLKRVLKSKIVWALDEFAMPALMSKQNKNVFFDNKIIADIIPFKDKFYLSTKKYSNYIFYYDGTSTYGYYLNENKELIKEEFMYIHFQKRNLKLDIHSKCLSNSELLITETVITDNTIDEYNILLKRKSGILSKVKLKVNRTQNTMKKTMRLIKEGNLFKVIEYRRKCKELFGNKTSI